MEIAGNGNFVSDHNGGREWFQKISVDKSVVMA
jgi:hypothetical protein